MTSKSVYVNTTVASIGFTVFLTFGFIWSSFYKEAPFTIYMEGLVIALGLITGKRLAQKWSGKKTGFRTDAQQESKTKTKKEDEYIDD